MKKNNKENILIGIIFIIFVIEYFLNKNSYLLFLLNILLCVFIIYKCRFSYITLKTIILNYILSPIFIKYNFNQAYGILQSSNIELHFFEINAILVIYNCITSLIMINTNFLKKEKVLLELKPEINKIFADFSGIMAILFAVIALPSLPFIKFDEAIRFKALLPGNAWNHLTIIFLIFAYPKFKENNIVKVSYIFCIFWFLAHYERVDILGIIILLGLLFITNVDIKTDMKRILKICFIGLCLFAMMIGIGELRDNKTKINIIEKILMQNTASDLGYVFNASVDMNLNKENLNGKSYIAYLVEAIPLLQSKDRIELIIQSKYNTPGGCYLLSEPLVNFGIMGVIIFELIENLILYGILSIKSDIKFFIYCYVIAASFRICWYGLIYIEMGILYFIPIIYLLKHIMNKYLSKNRRVEKLDV